AIFASSIPEIIELVGSRSKYSGEYKREHGKSQSRGQKMALNTFMMNLKEANHFDAVFASWIPEITELAANRCKYGGQYKRERGRRYPKNK
ncbi:GSCOCG00009223001-RA-CDS, partial [Cotesia congregata]